MKVLRSLAVFTAIALNCFLIQAGPSAEKAEPAGYRLTVELKDGSRIIGRSHDEHFEFKSESLGEMRLPLEKVRSVEMLAKGKEARLVTAAQDSLTVELAMKDIRVETKFGEVKLPVALIKSVKVSGMGKGRPTDGLIGMWSGNGDTTDSVGGNGGMNRSVIYTDGVAGRAFSFWGNSAPYGTHTSIDIPDKPEYVLTRELSIDAWIRPRGDGNVIFTRGDNRPGMDPYTISMDGHHTVIFQITDDNGRTEELRASNIPYGQWTHVAGTFASDAGLQRLYTNGVLAVERKTDIKPIGELLSNLSPGVGIGNVNDGMNNFPFMGDIDEVALYNRALSPAEVKAIYMEHAATADGKAEMMNGRPQTNYRLRDGFKPAVDSN